MRKKQAFIPYNQHQLNMLHINLDDLIPENHMVRVVDAAIEKMNTKILFDKYEGGRMLSDRLSSGQTANCFLPDL